MRSFLSGRGLTIVLVMVAGLATAFILYHFAIVTVGVSCEFYTGTLNEIVLGASSVALVATAVLLAAYVARCFWLRRFRDLWLPSAVGLVVGLTFYLTLEPTILYCFLHGVGPLNIHLGPR
jgi:hypothetical protein